jgi:hypothetical protein
MLVLRHELAILRRQAARPTLDADLSCALRGAESLVAASGLGELPGQAGDLLGWHRQLVAQPLDVSAQDP